MLLKRDIPYSGASQSGFPGYGITKFGTTRFGITQCGISRFGITQYGITRYGNTTYGNTRYGNNHICSLVVVGSQVAPWYIVLLARNKLGRLGTTSQHSSWTLPACFTFIIILSQLIFNIIFLQQYPAAYRVLTSMKLTKFLEPPNEGN